MKKHICRGRCAFYDCKSALLVTDVLILSGIEEEVADGSNEGVNTKSEVCKKEVCPRSGGEAFGLELGVVDDDASDKAEEEGKDEANYVFVVHSESPFFIDYIVGTALRACIKDDAPGCSLHIISQNQRYVNKILKFF
jgi:hypothetical protein